MKVIDKKFLLLLSVTQIYLFIEKKKSNKTGAIYLLEAENEEDLVSWVLYIEACANINDEGLMESGRYSFFFLKKIIIFDLKKKL